MDDKPKDAANKPSLEQESRTGNLVQVDVANLQMGMYIAELDCPWIETPFLMQGFELSNKSQQKTLEKYCQHVYIRSQFAAAKKKVEAAPRVELNLIDKADRGTMLIQSNRSKLPTKKSITRARPAYEVKLPVREEHASAAKAYSKGKSVIHKILLSAQLGEQLDTRNAEMAVEGCVESMLRNPDAMIWMSKIKHESQYTIEHCLNVCVLALAFGRHLNFDKAELQLLGLCGLLHDVGKMRIPKVILNKHGELSEEEFLIMCQHATEGYKLLKNEGSVPRAAVDVALNHHERPDGNGYPRGLKQNQISEFARIIAIVDTYDALTSSRCYSKAVSPVDAQKEIYRNRGQQFDEEYALAFMQAIGPYPPGTIVELRNGLVGIVLTGRRKFRHLPTVIVLRDSDKQSVNGYTVDLYLTDTGKLSKDYLIRRSLPDGAFGLRLEYYKIQGSGDLLSSSE